MIITSPYPDDLQGLILKCSDIWNSHPPSVEHQLKREYFVHRDHVVLTIVRRAGRSKINIITAMSASEIRGNIESLVTKKDFHGAVVQCEELEILVSADSEMDGFNRLSTYTLLPSYEESCCLANRFDNDSNCLRYSNLWKALACMSLDISSISTKHHPSLARGHRILSWLQTAPVEFGAEHEHWAKVHMALLLILDDV